MALLPSDPREQQKFLVVFVTVGAAVLFWMYVYSPRQDELAEMEDRIATLETQNRRAEARTGNLDQLRAELQDTERLFRALERLVPSRAEVPEIYQSIATESQNLGLEMQSVVPSEPQRQQDRYYLRQTWNMTVRGTYHDIGEFLARVASFPRIVRPQVSSIMTSEAGQDGEMRVTAAFELETFVLPPGREGSTGSGGGGDAATE